MADVKTLTVNNVTYNIKDETARQSLADVVHKTGDETIGGEKTFTEVMQGVAPNSNSNDASIPTTAWVRSSLGLDYANPSLSNLNGEGKNIGNWSNNVSNCIVKDPNNIIYTFDNSGTFTLKAGSKVYVPDGATGARPDGFNWTNLRETLDMSSLISVAFDGTTFVAVHQHDGTSTTGYLYYISTDGINWTSIMSYAFRQQEGGRYAPFLTAIVYTGSCFVTIGSSGHVFYKESASTGDWVHLGGSSSYGIKIAVLGSHSWRAAAYGNNKVVAIGSTGYIATSSNPTSASGWENISQNENLGEHDWSAIVYGNSKFIAFGNFGYISTSTDGINWSPASVNSALATKTLAPKSVIYDGTRFMALYYDGYIATSTDGVNWDVPQQTNLTSVTTWRSIIRDNTNNKYFVFADTYSAVSKDITEGLNFKAVTIQNDISLTADSIGGERYVFVNESGTGFASWDNDGRWIYSGTSFPTGTGHGIMFYNTNENTIRYTFNDGASWSDKLSFPIAKITANSAGTRLDFVGEVFDGIVWIGSHVALLPGLTLAFPDGRNPDGSCKNIIKTVNKVIIEDLYSRGSDWLIAWEGSSDIAVGGWWTERFYTQFPKKAPEANDWMMVWDERKNQFFQSDNGSPYRKRTCCVIARYRRDVNTQYMPKSWEIKRAFRAIERFDILHMLDLIYPVGSIYLEANNAGSCPLAFVMQGTVWELVSQDRALWGGNGSNATSLLSETLPNHQHWTGGIPKPRGGQCKSGSTHSDFAPDTQTLYSSWASESNSIYNNNHIRPNSYVVNVWRRVQ